MSRGHETMAMDGKLSKILTLDISPGLDVKLYTQRHTMTQFREN